MIEVEPGDPARKFMPDMAEDMFVSAVYPPLPGHDGKDATVLVSASHDRPIRGVDELLG